MIYRFLTFEQASLFLMEKQSEGFFAELLHPNSSMIYGPIASGGFSVLVSEHAAHEYEEVPETSVSYPLLIHWLAKILFAFSAITLLLPTVTLAIYLVFNLTFHLLLISIDNPIKTAFILLTLLFKGFLFILLFSLYIQTLSSIFRAYKDPSNSWHKPVKTALKAISFLTMLTIFFYL